MKYHVVVQPQAQFDIIGIYDWIDARSPDGALAWHSEWQRALRSLSDDPLRHGFAPESKFATSEVRQILFRTRYGRTYRAIFAVSQDVVNVLHVRGPGQPPIDPDANR